jgi:hypothetical protein
MSKLIMTLICTKIANLFRKIGQKRHHDIILIITLIITLTITLIIRLSITLITTLTPDTVHKEADTDTQKPSFSHLCIQGIYEKT